MKNATKIIDGHELMFERRRYGSQTFTWVSLLRGPKPAPGQDYAPDAWVSLGDPWPAINPARAELLKAIAQVISPPTPAAVSTKTVGPLNHAAKCDTCSATCPNTWSDPRGYITDAEGKVYCGQNCYAAQHDEPATAPTPRPTLNAPYRISKQAMADLKRRAAAEKQADAEQPEPFQLDSTPKPTFWKAPKQPKARQTVLFSGLNLMAGQNDLFATDGSAE